MSTLTKDGVSEVQNTACDALLAHRVEQKMAGNKVNVGGLYITHVIYDNHYHV